jgi:hypothetical protein
MKTFSDKHQVAVLLGEGGLQQKIGVNMALQSFTGHTGPVSDQNGAATGVGAQHS